jgi:hypothetical protein
VDKNDFLESLVGQTLIDAMTATAEAMAECFAPPLPSSKDEAEAQKSGAPFDATAAKSSN